MSGPGMQLIGEEEKPEILDFIRTWCTFWKGGR